MATERQLRERMRQLEEAIARQETESRRIQQQILQENQNQIRRMQTQAQEVYQRRLNETAEVYAQRVRQFQETVLRQNRQQLEQLNREAEAVRHQTQAYMQQMEQCNKELQEELQKLKADAQRQSTAFAQAAEEARNQAENSRQQVAQTPHDFFFPQEFDIISTHIQDIANLIDMGMYQAAVSDANCIDLEFKLLQTKVQQAFSEWMQAFEDYRTIVEALYHRLQTFESRPLETSAGTFCMKPRELNFWSCGAYSELAQKITDAYDSVHAMDQAQILEYLRSQTRPNRRAIYDLVTQSRRWEDQLIAVINCIVSERIFSDQRYVVAGEIAERLESLNYWISVDQFDPPSPNKLSLAWYIAPEDEDPINSFDLHMTMGRNNQVKLRIIPRRDHGLAVANLFFLSVELPSAADATTEQLVAEQTLEQIKQVLQEHNIQTEPQFIPSAENPEATIRQREQSVSPPPSTNTQIRYLERRYL